ncbi:MAG: bifunctional tetrahydrofolate synthase/dihydrofolate synthase [Pseudomonadota bacterium]
MNSESHEPRTTLGTQNASSFSAVSGEEHSNSKTCVADWLHYISTMHGKTIDMTLERVRTVWQRLQCVPTCPVITVAGTNGKGSTCAFLSAICKAAGLKVGTYTSPHIWRFNERIALQGVPVEDQVLIKAFEAIDAAREDISLTYFEWATLAGLWTFAQANLDIWILEVGLGGRLDATNIIDTTLAIVTPIDLDHQEYLGSTREAIALEKLGIARSNSLLILGDANFPEMACQKAQQLASKVLSLGKDFGYLTDTPQQWQYWVRASDGNIKRRFGLPWPALRGEHQLANASVAITALEYLSDIGAISMQAIREGLLAVEWPGRFQVLAGQPVTVWDVAHNPHAMKALAINLEKMAFFPDTWCVWGMLNDKEALSCAKILQPHVQQWAVCTLEGERRRSSQELYNILVSLGVEPKNIHQFDHPTAAYSWVRNEAQLADRIVVTGSFSTLEAVRDL